MKDFMSLSLNFSGHQSDADEELDFIINYDIKYRMGRDVEDGAED